MAVSGVEFFLRGRSIPTDGSGRLLITDISLYNRLTSTSDEEALICRSNRNVQELFVIPHSNAWYLDPEVKTTKKTFTGERISGYDDEGWTMNRDTVRVNGEGTPFHRVVRLKKLLWKENSHVTLLVTATIISLCSYFILVSCA